MLWRRRYTFIRKLYLDFLTSIFETINHMFYDLAYKALQEVDILIGGFGFFFYFFFSTVFYIRHFLNIREDQFSSLYCSDYKPCNHHIRALFWSCRCWFRRNRLIRLIRRRRIGKFFKFEIFKPLTHSSSTSRSRSIFNDLFRGTFCRTDQLSELPFIRQARGR